MITIKDKDIGDSQTLGELKGGRMPKIGTAPKMPRMGVKAPSGKTRMPRMGGKK